MRKTGLLLLLLVSTSSLLPAQSVTISSDKLDELTVILQQYVTVTQALQQTLKQQQTSLDSSTASINALQLGLTQYEKTVNEVVIPKMRTQESQIFWLKVGLGVSVGVDAAALVYLGGHALHFW